MSEVFYYGDGKPLADEQDCLAVIYYSEIRYRVYYFPLQAAYTIKVDGTVYDASCNTLGATL